MAKPLHVVADVIDLVLRERYPDGRVPSDVRVVAEGIKLDVQLLDKMLPPEHIDGDQSPADNVIRLDEHHSGDKPQTPGP